MIPGIHYPTDENYSSKKSQTQCPYCGYLHKADITFYKECSNCRKPMTDYQKKLKGGTE